MADNRKHTRVVNIRKEAYDVYIGRAGKGQDRYFGNPFRLKQDMVRGGTLAGFREYFYRRLVNDAEYRRRFMSCRERLWDASANRIRVMGILSRNTLTGWPGVAKT